MRLAAWLLRSEAMIHNLSISPNVKCCLAVALGGGVLAKTSEGIDTSCDRQLAYCLVMAASAE